MREDNESRDVERVLNAGPLLARVFGSAPPLLLIWDSAAGKYVTCRRVVCTAVWASASVEHATGDLCAREASFQIGDAWFCEHHYRRARSWIGHCYAEEMAAKPDELRRSHELALELDRERAGERMRLDLERISALEAAEEALGVVYYVERETDGLVKIGTTRRLEQRMAALRREHGPVTLLARHRGTHKREARMHTVFALLRVEGEWFRPDAQLRDWIASVSTRQYSVPTCRGQKAIVRSVLASVVDELWTEIHSKKAIPGSAATRAS